MDKFANFFHLLLRFKRLSLFALISLISTVHFSLFLFQAQSSSADRWQSFEFKSGTLLLVKGPSSINHTHFGSCRAELIERQCKKRANICILNCQTCTLLDLLLSSDSYWPLWAGNSTFGDAHMLRCTLSDITIDCQSFSFLFAHQSLPVWSIRQRWSQSCDTFSVDSFDWILWWHRFSRHRFGHQRESIQWVQFKLDNGKAPPAHLHIYQSGRLSVRWQMKGGNGRSESVRHWHITLADCDCLFFFLCPFVSLGEVYKLLDTHICQSYECKHTLQSIVPLHFCSFTFFVQSNILIFLQLIPLLSPSLHFGTHPLIQVHRFVFSLCLLSVQASSSSIFRQSGKLTFFFFQSLG